MLCLVKCDFCPKMIEPTPERECAWMNGRPTNWICDDCNAESEQSFALSDMYRDMRESEINEQEPSDMMAFL